MPRTIVKIPTPVLPDWNIFITTMMKHTSCTTVSTINPNVTRNCMVVAPSCCGLKMAGTTVLTNTVALSSKNRKHDCHSPKVAQASTLYNAQISNRAEDCTWHMIGSTTAPP
jgi:hypothetical protein